MMTPKEQIVFMRDNCPDIWKLFSKEGYYCPDEFGFKNFHGEGCVECWRLALEGEKKA